MIKFEDHLDSKRITPSDYTVIINKIDKSLNQKKIFKMLNNPIMGFEVVKVNMIYKITKYFKNINKICKMDDVIGDDEGDALRSCLRRTTPSTRRR